MLKQQFFKSRRGTVSSSLRALAVVLCAALSLGVVSCGDKEEEELVVEVPRSQIVGLWKMISMDIYDYVEDSMEYPITWEPADVFGGYLPVTDSLATHRVYVPSENEITVFSFKDNHTAEMYYTDTLRRKETRYSYLYGYFDLSGVIYVTPTNDSVPDSDTTFYHVDRLNSSDLIISTFVKGDKRKRYVKTRYERFFRREPGDLFL